MTVSTLLWIAAALVWGLLLSSARSPSLVVKPAIQEEAAAWQWLTFSIVLMAAGTVAQFALAGIRVGALPVDISLPPLSSADQWFFAVAGDWLLCPMLWILLDWRRKWPEIIASGDRWGHPPQAAGRLFRVVTGGAVVANFAMVLTSALG